MNLYDLFTKTIRGPWKTAGDETQYRIESDGDTLYLIFEGSSHPKKSKADWIANFTFWPVAIRPYKSMTRPWMAHWGFVQRFKACAEVVMHDALMHLGDKKIVVLGYSHGAALALLAHEWLAYHGYKPEGYGFGCPRVLFLPGRMIKARLSNFHPVRNRGDIVTHAPFVWQGYGHNQLVKVGKWRLIGVKPHFASEYANSLLKSS